MRAVESAVAGGDLAAVDAPVDDSVRISTSLSARDTPSMRARTPPQKIEHDSSQPRPSSTRESSLEGETEEDEKTRRASEEDDDHDDRDRDARGRTRDRARARRRGADDVDADASDASDASEASSEEDEDDDDPFDPAADPAPGPPCTLRLEYWMRSEECTERKRAHIAAIDAEGGYWGMEDHIERTVFGVGGGGGDDGRGPSTDVALERNMFPYECPPGISHWTLWSKREMRARDIVAWCKPWLAANVPGCVEWNYDMNDNNSVDVPHYHVFVKEKEEEEAAASEGRDEGEAAGGEENASAGDDARWAAAEEEEEEGEVAAGATTTTTTTTTTRKRRFEFGDAAGSPAAAPRDKFAKTT
jgi:hypothetical protein